MKSEQLIQSCSPLSSLHPTPLPRSGSEGRKTRSSLHGEVAVVTGAAGGIGRPLCQALAAAGCRLGLIGRTPAKLDAFVSDLRPTGAPLSAHAVDVGDRAALTAALAAIESDLGHVD